MHSKPGKMPLAQPVDLHREQLDLIPTLQLAHAIAQIRRNPRDGLAGTRPTHRGFTRSKEPLGIISPA